jgi:hypothetical protein
MSEAAMTTIDQPLGLGELLAETVRLYSNRFAASIGLGAPIAGAFLATLALPPVVNIFVVAVAFTATYAAAARVASGDGFVEAWAQTGLRLPTLLLLSVVVAVPFALAVGQLFLLILAVAWLAFTGFSIPVAVLEHDPEATSWFGRLSFALSRSARLARAEYLHAAGIVAALVVIVILLGIPLAVALSGVAESGREAAAALTQLVLAPFFFLGLSVLYFEQKARALSSPREQRT